MAMLVQNVNGHIQSQLTRSLEKILDDANQSGELKLSNRKLKDFPKTSEKYNLRDTVIADLSKNRFSELPEEVTSFHFLEKLHCYHNAIRYIPDSIVNLQCLMYVDLSRNQLSTLPRELCQLPIKILLVSNNYLTQLPDELNRMSQLTELDASCNQLTHLPPRMGDLRSLQSLVLRNNLLLAVPIEVTFLKLARLDLRANRIGSLPIEIRDMATLIELLVEDNPLTSPPASLCRRGRVHIFKYLDNEAARLDRKMGGGGGTLGRRSRKGGTGSSPGPPLLVDRLKHKRQNVDSGYSTSSDGFDKRWSQEMEEKSWTSTPLLTRTETNGTHSILSTPSTASPAPEINNEEDFDGGKEGYRLSPGVDACGQYNGNNEAEEKTKPLHQIQTYKEYKDALKQQRAHDVPAIYRTKNPDDQTTYKTEPNTPTHHATTSHGSLATSKSDPTPLNSALSGAKYVFDDTKKAEKTSPYKRTSSPNHAVHNGNTVENNKNNVGGKYIQEYVKPKSPVKGKTGILSHDNVPSCNANGLTRTRAVYMNGANENNTKGLNGVKGNRTITWNKDVPMEKMTFTMRREIDKAREETDLINQLRNIIETRLKMTLPEDLAPTLTDGVVLCHLANHIKPRSVASIHVPSPAVPKLTMARCRRNVDNFIEACRKIGVDENLVCCAADVLEGRGLVQIAITVTELLRFHSPRSPLHTNPISTDEDSPSKSSSSKDSTAFSTAGSLEASSSCGRSISSYENEMPPGPPGFNSTKAPTTSSTTKSTSTTTTTTSAPPTTTSTTAKPTTTTTPSPTTTSTTSKTTTTTSKTTTTTSKTTTTTAPITTTTKTTTTAKPSPPPVDPVGTWFVNVTNTNKTCLILQAALQVDLPYKVDNASKTFSIAVPPTASAGGACGENVENMTLTFSASNAVNFNFKKNKDGKKYDLESVVITLNVTLPGQKDWQLFVLAHNKDEFSTPVSNSYKCTKEQTFNLMSVPSTNNTAGILRISHLQVQAFRNETNTKFDEALDCQGSETPDVVPIAVGCALAALVIIVLVAYLIGRRRSQARGYLSM